ncbi:thioesterase II family protein [Streptomyces halobius]|uniref:Alpha/beta fold hydrolase n=1 Tax=Streptomyces halobius TaxID=2879846 RepID=A0ABY4LYR0_9ACTN|nr:alpha/beta fold hydrolase [Streptomyces halobius]UQA90600.1 alpha/beta fold hydrolase [Streptomyces halobius]
MAQTGDRNSLWIRGVGPATHKDTRVRLVCFPHAGGAASFYHPLATEVGQAAEVLAVQYPGRQDRRGEPACVTIAELADHVHDEIQAWTDRPLVFFGHSMGAVIAYEVTRRMQRQGEHSPLGMIVSGRRAPCLPFPARNVHQHGDAALIEELRRQSGTAASLLEDKEVVRMILPSLRGDYRAIETYRHQEGPELTCPITAMTGRQDPGATEEQVRAWRNHTHAAFELRLFPGGHFYLSDRWDAVGEAVRDCLTTFAHPVATH